MNCYNDPFGYRPQHAAAENAVHMKRPLPTTTEEWLKEIGLAMSDASETKPFGILTGSPITDANLFHLAPLVALKFRGRYDGGAKSVRMLGRCFWGYAGNIQQGDKYG